ncbi:MAG: F0F1 ATP synthase subunit A [Flavobacteriales bacterium]
MLKLRSLYLLVFLLAAPLFSALANTSEKAGSNEKKKGKKFDAGHTILHHVKDAHSVHFFDVGHTHVTLYLPCIVYGPNGLDVFSSSNFYNEHHEAIPYTASSGTTYFLHEEKIKTLTNGKLVNVYDFSITKTVLGMLIAMVLVCWMFISMAKKYRRQGTSAPKGLQSWLEPLIVFIRDEVAKPSIGEKKHARYMPYLLSIFWFIFICNLMGLIPFIGGFNITGNIAITMVLALFTFIIMLFHANKNFWLHIVAPPGVPIGLMPLLVIIEIVGLFSKPMVLMLRLFANVTAGHIIILSFVCLIFIFGEMSPVAGYSASPLSIAFSIFMNLLELLVAFLQAYVFTLLSALYFGQATEEHHHEEAHH